MQKQRFISLYMFFSIHVVYEIKKYPQDYCGSDQSFNQNTMYRNSLCFRREILSNLTKQNASDFSKSFFSRACSIVAANAVIILSLQCYGISVVLWTRNPQFLLPTDAGDQFAHSVTIPVACTRLFRNHLHRVRKARSFPCCSRWDKRVGSRWKSDFLFS